MSDSPEGFASAPICFSSLSASCWAPGGGYAGGIAGAGLGNNAIGVEGAGLGNNASFSLMDATSGGNNSSFSLLDATSGRSGGGGNNESFSLLDATSGNNASQGDSLCLNSIMAETTGNNVKNDTAPAVAPEVQPAAAEVKPATDAKPAAPEHQPCKDGEKPVVKITDGNKPEEKAKADIVVKADGTIERNGNCLESDKPHSEYRVAVEAGAPEAKVAEALAELKTGIEAKGAAPSLDVPEELSARVSERTRALFSKDEEAEEEEGQGPPPGGGGGGGGGGPVPQPDGSEEDDKNQDGDGQTDGGDRGGERRSATAADVRNAFATSEYTNMRANSLGRYSENVGGWIGWCLGCTDEELAELIGNPPDPKKLQALMKNPAFRQKMAGKLKNMEEQGDAAGAQKLGQMFDKLGNDEKFATDFCSFLQNQKSGKDATPAEMQQFFSPEIQDAVQSSRVCDMASQMKLDMKNPSAITEAQMKDLARNIIAGHVMNDAEKAEMASKQATKWAGYEQYADMVKSKFLTLLAANETNPRPRV